MDQHHEPCRDRCVDRRRFLGLAASLGLGLAWRERALADEGTTARTATSADAVIVLWMAGGMAHTDTFDPKHYTPFEVGIDPAKVLSTFPAVDTVVDGV